MTNRKQTMLNDELRMTNEDSGIQHSSFNIQHFSLGIFGDITNPLGNQFKEAAPYASITSGLPLFMSNMVRLTTLAGGLWMFSNLLVAGFTYLTSNGEAEKIAKAWNIIWQSLIGVLIIVASFAITGVISQVMFGDATAILKPTIFGPGKAN